MARLTWFVVEIVGTDIKKFLLLLPGCLIRGILYRTCPQLKLFETDIKVQVLATQVLVFKIFKHINIDSLSLRSCFFLSETQNVVVAASAAPAVVTNYAVWDFISYYLS